MGGFEKVLMEFASYYDNFLLAVQKTSPLSSGYIAAPVFVGYVALGVLVSRLLSLMAQRLENRWERA